MFPELKRLHARAASFDELVSDSFSTCAATPFQRTRAQIAVLAVIREHFSGDKERYRKRLEADGLTVEDVLKRIANPRPSQNMKPPQWLTDIPDFLLALRRVDTTVASDQPFRQVFTGLIDEARAQRDRKLGSRALTRLSKSASTDFDQLLFVRLADLTTPLLYRAFDQYRASCGQPAAANSSTIYDAFIQHMSKEGWRKVSRRTPVMLRLIATVTRQWIEASAEFLSRLDADADDIARLLDLQSLPELSSVQGQVSDPHNHGRTVYLLTFSGGQRICYKPKSLTIDCAWADLVARFNNLSPPATLRTAHVLNRQSYGWCEFVVCTPLAEETSARTFFYRSGGLLALMHATCAADVHEENIIASGDQPIPIDLETALQPARRASPSYSDPDAALALAFERIAQSVLAVGLLPAPRTLAQGHVALMGGLNDRKSVGRVPRLHPANTDTMHPIDDEVVWAPTHNLPTCDGRRIPVSAHADAFIDGLTDTLTFLAQPRVQSELNGVLAYYADARLRLILKPTQFYMMVMEHLLDHRRMSNGLRWSFETEALTATFGHRADPYWPLAIAEREAMTRLDVPFFWTKANDTAVTDCEGHRATPLARSALDHTRDRLARLTSEHVAVQRSIARFSLFKAKPATPHGPSHSRLLAPAEYLAQARLIADRLAQCAIVADVSATWIAAETLGDTTAQTLSPLGPSLYSGSAGIAFFLACEAHASGDVRHLPLILKSLAPLRASITKVSNVDSLGAAGGLASAIYTLTKIAELTGRTELLDDATRAIRLATPQCLANNKEHDLLAGSAGLLLALFALDRARAIRESIELANTLAEIILAAQPLGLTGFAHGNASLALALARFAERSGNSRIWPFVERLLDAEDRCLDAHLCNWADLRSHVSQEHRFSQSQWCHGAAGIALSRALLICHPRLDQFRINRDLKTAIDAMRMRIPRANDTLCCGNLGIALILDTIARCTKQPQLDNEAKRLAASVVRRASDAGDYQWVAGSSEFNLGLFQGIAGVGYAMLRMARPTLPLVLALT